MPAVAETIIVEAARTEVPHSMSNMRVNATRDEEIIQYLKTNWDAIDAVMLPRSPDGRLPKEKVFLKYLETLSNGKLADALVLEAIFERYDEICQSYEDAYYGDEETLLGISEEDVSVYEQKLAGVAEHKRKPSHWRLPDNQYPNRKRLKMTG
jgi:hypothetical protein